jgi:cell pole-organizing protein PopZ
MAMAGSAQREPSMEEILASIRRIIEDSDPGRKPGDADDRRFGESENPWDNSENSPVEMPAPEVDAFRAELRAGLDVDRPLVDRSMSLSDVQAEIAAVAPEVGPAKASGLVEPQPSRPPLTLADVGARIATEQRLADELGKPTEPARPPQPVDALVADWRRDIAAAGEPEKPASAVVQPVFSDTRQPVEVESEVEISEDELTLTPVAAAPPAAELARTALTEESVERPAIVSEHTGRQVAAAFGELSEAFAARSKKTFDEMAEAMLRPMLQDWLDNNLPTLVEKLVREEIERVARGA